MIKAHKRAADRAAVGNALLKMVDDAVLFGLLPSDAVQVLHHALAATTAHYFGAGAANYIKEYGAALPALVAQYAEAEAATKSPLIVMADGTPAVVSNESDTKH